MIARGFKSVIWVATVGGAALCCYMVSLRVATERAELAKVESQIVLAKRDIRSLQTELGTRGRLTQLEQWNSDVLALSAPTSAQFVKDQVTLARLERHDRTVADQAGDVRLASAEVPQAGAAAAATAPKPEPAPKLIPAIAPAPQQPAMVHHASYSAPVASAVPATKSPPKPAATKAAALSVAAPAKPQTAAAKPPKSESAAVAVAKPKSQVERAATVSPAAAKPKPIAAAAAKPKASASLGVAAPARAAAKPPAPSRTAKPSGSGGHR